MCIRDSIYLEGDSITVNGPNLLAFDADIDWDIKRVQGGTSAAMAGGLYNMELRGTGWVAAASSATSAPRVVRTAV